MHHIATNFNLKPIKNQFMYRKLLLFIFCLSCITNNLKAQWIPTTTFTSPHSVCDPSSYQLVFYDEFNGNTLGAPWITWNTWAGQPTDQWSDGRLGNNTILKDGDVEVSNGTVKLKLVKEPTSFTWYDANGSHTIASDYSSGYLATPYNQPGQPQWAFDAGKFEARIKMPVAKYSHSAFWLWPGGGGIDELDIAEAWGRTNTDFNGGFPHVSNSIHSWNPDASQPNPYNITTHYWISENYPNQTWTQWVTNSAHFHQQDFHTYTCEWDTAVVNFYLDGSLTNQYYKYYQTRCHWNWYGFWSTCTHYQVYPTCSPISGAWDVLKGFPYNNQSGSQIRLGLGLDRYDANQGPGFEDQMEIDYVKVWQRHPQGAWTGCQQPDFYIDGTKYFCSPNTQTYNIAAHNGANINLANGSWTVTGVNGANGLNIVNSSNTSVTLATSTNNVKGYFVLTYTGTDQLCNNTVTISTDLYVGPPQPYIPVTVIKAVFPIAGGNFFVYYLNVDPGVSAQISQNYPFTYNWTATCSDYPNHTFNLTGHTAVLAMGISQGPTTHTINWTLNASNPCGTVTKSGQTQFYFKTTDTTVTENNDSTIQYFSATVPDTLQDSFFTNVQARVANMWIPDTTDTVSINAMIAQIEMEELLPYIDTTQFTKNGKSQLNVNQLPSSSATMLYPNPTTGVVNVRPNNQYQNGPLSIVLSDLYGKKWLQKEYIYRTGEVISIASNSLPTGIYIVEIKQNEQSEKIKLIRY